MNIRKIIKEEINDFDWVGEHQFTHKELIQHIHDNNITEWLFGEHWDGNLILYGTPIENLGNLKSVGSYLDLYETSIETLGNLQSVGGYLNLRGTSIETLGNLKSVGGDLDLYRTPISGRYSENEIRQMVQVNGNVYL